MYPHWFPIKLNKSVGSFSSRRTSLSCDPKRRRRRAVLGCETVWSMVREEHYLALPPFNDWSCCKGNERTHARSTESVNSSVNFWSSSRPRIVVKEPSQNFALFSSSSSPSSHNLNIFESTHQSTKMRKSPFRRASLHSSADGHHCLMTLDGDDSFRIKNKHDDSIPLSPTTPVRKKGLKRSTSVSAKASRDSSSLKSATMSMMFLSDMAHHLVSNDKRAATACASRVKKTPKKSVSSSAATVPPKRKKLVKRMASSTDTTTPTTPKSPAKCKSKAEASKRGSTSSISSSLYASNSSLQIPDLFLMNSDHSSDSYLQFNPAASTDTCSASASAFSGSASTVTSILYVPSEHTSAKKKHNENKDNEVKEQEQEQRNSATSVKSLSQPCKQEDVVTVAQTPVPPRKSAMSHIQSRENSNDASPSSQHTPATPLPGKTLRREGVGSLSPNPRRRSARRNSIVKKKEGATDASYIAATAYCLKRNLSRRHSGDCVSLVSNDASIRSQRSWFSNDGSIRSQRSCFSTFGDGRNGSTRSQRSISFRASRTRRTSIGHKWIQWTEWKQLSKPQR